MNDLYDQGRKIISLFRTLTTEPKNSADGGDANAVSPIQFAKEGERFEIWAHSLGLQQRGHSSLDYRVRDAAQIRTYLREVLDELIDHLQNAIEIVRGERLPAEELAEELVRDTEEHVPDEGALSDTDTSSLPSSLGSFTEAGFRLTSISERIDSLYGVAMKIRNPRNYPQRATIDLYQNVPPEEREEYMQSRNEIETNIVSYIRGQQISQELQSEAIDVDQAVIDYAAPSNWLIRRAGAANARRKQQFVYWKRRSDALTRVNETLTLETRSKIREKDAVRNETTSALLPSARARTESVVHGGLLSRATSATYLDPNLAVSDDAESTISHQTRISSVLSPQGDKLEWPPPPKYPEAGAFFTCGYCRMLCPRRYLDPEAWRNHVAYDLRPYHCTYEKCSTPYQLYGSRRDWTAHENQHRVVWHCGRDGEEFESQKLFAQHLKTNHPEAPEVEFTPELLAAVASPSSQPGRDCPFCPSAFTDVPHMRKHLLYHLEKLALLSLPTAEDAADIGLGDDSEGSNKAFGQRGRVNSIAMDFTDAERASFLSLGRREDIAMAEAPNIDTPDELAALLRDNVVTKELRFSRIHVWKQGLPGYALSGTEDVDKQYVISRPDIPSIYPIANNWFEEPEATMDMEESDGGKIRSGNEEAISHPQPSAMRSTWSDDEEEERVSLN